MALQASNGYFIAVSSVGAQLRISGASDYCISKHAMNRLVEFIVIGELLSLISGLSDLNHPAEYPQIKAFSFHPGEILTEMQKYARGVDWSSIKYDSPQLSTATMLFLTSGRMDWLNGRQVLPGTPFLAQLLNALFQVRVGELGPRGDRERHESAHHDRWRRCM